MNRERRFGLLKLKRKRGRMTYEEGGPVVLATRKSDNIMLGAVWVWRCHHSVLASVLAAQVRVCVFGLRLFCLV